MANIDDETNNFKKLFIVATPIGNLEDLSIRAKKTLETVDFVICEDTRVTRNLLTSYEISAKTLSLHQHSTDSDIENVLKKANSFALVTDAGTPGISDPGGKIVASAREMGFVISPIPGPAAITAALSVAGFSTDRFTFLGFPPQKKGRSKFFDEVEEIPHTVVLYESRYRIEKTLEALNQDRYALLGREVTKMFESFYFGTISEIRNELSSGSMKGEFVIVLAPSAWKN